MCGTELNPQNYFQIEDENFNYIGYFGKNSYCNMCNGKRIKQYFEQYMQEPGHDLDGDFERKLAQAILLIIDKISEYSFERNILFDLSEEVQTYVNTLEDGDRVHFIEGIKELAIKTGTTHNRAADALYTMLQEMERLSREYEDLD